MENQKSFSPRKQEELTIDTGRFVFTFEGFFEVKLDRDYLIVHKMDENDQVFATMGYLNPLSFSIEFKD